MREARLSLLFLFFAALVAEGCSQGSPLHSRYNNFLAYYNSYYNAEQKLEEGVKSLESSQETIDRTQLVSIFPSPASSGQASAFEDAIEKASELLRNRPSSKYSDDALFLIGKAYFYQQNFVGAQEKFRETLLLVEEEGDSRAVDEARFWLARTLSAAGSYDEGATVIRERLSSEDVDGRWRPRLQLAMGELLAQAGRYEEAAEVLQAGMEHVDDRNEGARAAFLLGQIFEELGRFDEAVGAFRSAEERHAGYEITYAARLNRAFVLGLDLERHAEALELIEEMKSDGKNYENRAEVELANARLVAASGDADHARNRFNAVLYDESLGGSSIRGEVHYRLAEWYRDVWLDYQRAAVHFDTAATVIRTPSDMGETRFTREAMLDAQKESQRFGAYAEAAGKLSEVDSLLELAYLDDTSFRERISEIEAQRRAEYLEEVERRGEREARMEFGGAVAENPNQRGAPEGEASTEVTEGAGFLGHRNAQAVESGRITFEQTWGTRPLVPNWRRQAVLAIAELASSEGTEVGLVQGAAQEGPPPLDVSNVPRTDAGRAEMEARRAELRYELANALFMGLSLPDSARNVYLGIIEETPDSPAAVRARYALAEIAHQEESADVAETYFRQVADLADDTALRNAALERLGEQTAERSNDDSDAERSFEVAKREWDAGKLEQAATSFVAVADEYPDSKEAPRALFASAAVLLEGISDEERAAMTKPASDSMLIGLSRVPVPESMRADDEGDEGLPDIGLPKSQQVETEDLPGKPQPVVLDDVEDPDAAERVNDVGLEVEMDEERNPAAGADSIGLVVDSVRENPSPQYDGGLDSLAISADTTTVEADTLESNQPGNHGQRALALLDRLISDYPQAEAAERAEALRNQLAQRMGITPTEDIDEPTTEESETEAESSFGLYGEVPVPTGVEGYTIQVLEAPNRSQPQMTLAQLRQEGVRAALARRTGESSSFLVVAGHFEAEIDAQAAAENLPADRQTELLQREEASVISLRGLENVEEEVQINDQEVPERRILD